jgi:hypothetical protein
VHSTFVSFPFLQRQPHHHSLTFSRNLSPPPLTSFEAATRDANRLAEALQQQADDAARQLRALEQKHAQALNQCRSEAQANATTLQQQHDASLKALEAKHVAELDACKAKLQKEQREAITELSRQGDTWCSKAAAAEARAEEALSGRAAAEARARDALDREVKRLREVM